MLGTIKRVHFSGVGGTAMAAAAAAMVEKGYTVTGSDQNVYPPTSTFLEERHIEVFQGYSELNVKHRPDLVVIGNALSRGNPEVEAVLEAKIPYCSLPELIKRSFLQGKRALVVTGTHGKTTTTSLLAWVFERSGLNPSFLIGGIPQNLGQGARFTDSEWFIIEGDEYDTAFFDKRSKFVHYQPEVAILNNLEFDHADIFEDLPAIQTSFRHFINLIPRNGLLLANGDDANVAPLLSIQHCPLQRYGLSETNDVRAEVRGTDGDSSSSFTVGGSEFRIGMVGEFNVRNALAVVASARHCGLSDGQIQAGFESFRGIRRRMEVRGVARGVTVVDDFGHHPTAIRETLRALRLRYPGKRIWAIFEPRSNTTRRSVFQSELVEAMALADGAVVGQVARLEALPPEQRLDTNKLVEDLVKKGCPSRYLPKVDSIVEHVIRESRDGDVVCVFSNGVFGHIHKLLLERLPGTQSASTIRG